METVVKHVMDLGRNKLVTESLPYHVVGDSAYGSLNSPLSGLANLQEILNFVVPVDHQLKILYLKAYTNDVNGAKFIIRQTNPSATGQTGTIEAYPVIGAVPPYFAGATAVRDVLDVSVLAGVGTIPVVLQGSLDKPVMVAEGSIDFLLTGPSADPPVGVYSLVWWGVIKNPDEPPV